MGLNSFYYLLRKHISFLRETFFSLGTKFEKEFIIMLLGRRLVKWRQCLLNLCNMWLLGENIPLNTATASNYIRSPEG